MFISRINRPMSSQLASYKCFSGSGNGHIGLAAPTPVLDTGIDGKPGSSTHPLNLALNLVDRPVPSGSLAVIHTSCLTACQRRI